MLEVQKYLLSGKTVSDLERELGISAKQHETLPLVILNYSQIESPKTNPIVRECRALTLNTQDWSIAAKSFNRFFNWGELAEEMKDFDFSSFTVQSKEDGSLVLLYKFQGEWRVNTRGSFATDKMEFQDFTWREGICKALEVSDLQEVDGHLDSQMTYVCEFCSPWNKVVRKYDRPILYLITCFLGEDEMSDTFADAYSQTPRQFFIRPHRYYFGDIEQIQQFLQRQAEGDPTFEGVVIKDHHGHRWKIKSATYLGFHRLRGESGNLFNPKHLLPFVLAGEEDELLTYFEEVRPKFFEVKSKVFQAYAQLLENWALHKDIAEQKEFALAVKDKPFSGLLFQIRKDYGAEQTVLHVKQAWRTAESQILKTIKF